MKVLKGKVPIITFDELILQKEISLPETINSQKSLDNLYKGWNVTHVIYYDVDHSFKSFSLQCTLRKEFKISRNHDFESGNQTLSPQFYNEQNQIHPSLAENITLRGKVDFETLQSIFILPDSVQECLTLLNHGYAHVSQIYTLSPEKLPRIAQAALIINDVSKFCQVLQTTCYKPTLNQRVYLLLCYRFLFPHLNREEQNFVFKVYLNDFDLQNIPNIQTFSDLVFLAQLIWNHQHAVN